MRIPRDLSGSDLVRRLGRLSYVVTRQTGSHIRLTSHARGEHHVTIPKHDPLRMGTLASILDNNAVGNGVGSQSDTRRAESKDGFRRVAAHHGMTRDALLQQLLE